MQQNSRNKDHFGDSSREPQRRNWRERLGIDSEDRGSVSPGQDGGGIPRAEGALPFSEESARVEQQWEDLQKTPSRRYEPKEGSGVPSLAEGERLQAAHTQPRGFPSGKEQEGRPSSDHFAPPRGEVVRPAPMAPRMTAKPAVPPRPIAFSPVSQRPGVLPPAPPPASALSLPKTEDFAERLRLQRQAADKSSGLPRSSAGRPSFPPLTSGAVGGAGVLPRSYGAAPSVPYGNPDISGSGAVGFEGTRVQGAPSLPTSFERGKNPSSLQSFHPQVSGTSPRALNLRPVSSPETEAYAPPQEERFAIPVEERGRTFSEETVFYEQGAHPKIERRFSRDMDAEPLYEEEEEVESRGTGKFLKVLVAIACMLLVIAGSGYALYTHFWGGASVTSGQIPVIEKPKVPVKVTPEGTEGAVPPPPTQENQTRKQIYDRLLGDDQDQERSVLPTQEQPVSPQNSKTPDGGVDGKTPDSEKGGGNSGAPLPLPDLIKPQTRLEPLDPPLLQVSNLREDGERPALRGSVLQEKQERDVEKFPASASLKGEEKKIEVKEVKEVKEGNTFKKQRASSPVIATKEKPFPEEKQVVKKLEDLALSTPQRRASPDFGGSYDIKPSSINRKETEQETQDFSLSLAARKMREEDPLEGEKRASNVGRGVGVVPMKAVENVKNLPPPVQVSAQPVLYQKLSTSAFYQQKERVKKEKFRYGVRLSSFEAWPKAKARALLLEKRHHNLRARVVEAEVSPQAQNQPPKGEKAYNVQVYDFVSEQDASRMCRTFFQPQDKQCSVVQLVR